MHTVTLQQLSKRQQSLFNLICGLTNYLSPLVQLLATPLSSMGKVPDVFQSLTDRTTPQICQTTPSPDGSGALLVLLVVQGHPLAVPFDAAAGDVTWQYRGASKRTVFNMCWR